MSSTDPRDRRTHARIQTRHSLEIVDAGRTVGVELRDLSHGGACLFLSASEGDVGDYFKVRIPGSETEPAVDLNSEVVRRTQTGDGQIFGVRFRETASDKLAAVDRLLGELLVKTGGGSRRHPRIARRIGVRCESPTKLIAMVENISRGGLAMNVAAELEPGEQVLVILPAEDGEDLLSLPARVANQRKLPDTDPPEFLIGLAFEALSPQRKALLDALLIGLLDAADEG